MYQPPKRKKRRRKGGIFRRLLVLLILSALLVNTGLPSGAAGGFLIAAYILSPFAGGFYIGKKAEQKKFLHMSIQHVILQKNFQKE